MFMTDARLTRSIANVLLQSGSSVPEWIMKLPKPSKMRRKQMGKIKREEFVNKARSIGRGDAIKKRYVRSVLEFEHSAAVISP